MGHRQLVDRPRPAVTDAPQRPIAAAVALAVLAFGTAGATTVAQAQLPSMWQATSVSPPPQVAQMTQAVQAAQAAQPGLVGPAVPAGRAAPSDGAVKADAGLQPAQASTAAGGARSTTRVATTAVPMPVGAVSADAESLPALLSRVLPRDPQVRVAEALLAAAEERRLQARSRLGPSVGVSAAYGDGRDFELLGPVNRRTDRAEASVRWNLYNYGNDAAELAGSERDLVAARAALRQAREEVAERVAEAYSQLLRVQSLRPRSQERHDHVRRLALQVQRQFDAGRASDADAQQAQASLLDAEIGLEQIVSDEVSARQRLAVLTGGAVRPVVAAGLPGSLDGPPAAPDAELAAPQPGLVVAAAERARAARARVRPVASVYAPRVDLEVRHSLGDRTRPQLDTVHDRSWQVTARWELPVLGEAQARRAENERRAEAVEADADRVLVGVRAELQSLPPRIENAERAIAQLDRQIAQYDALLRAGEIQFDAGRRTLAQLVQLHESRHAAEQRRAEQAHRLLTTRLRLLALTGRLLPALGQPLD